MIRFYNVFKNYHNGVKALKNINLHVHKGEFVFLVGSSGAGKSTITKLIFREELPSRGQVMVNGKNLMRMKTREIPYYRRNIGFVFQDFRLLNNKTVYENIAFALQVIGASSKDIKKSVPAVLEMVGLKSRANAMPQQLSGGEQQRVSIARALVNNPPIILADEPTGNLDSETAWDIMNLLKEINRRGTTVIMATHAKEIVKKMNNRVITLDLGCVIEDSAEGALANEA